MITVAILINGQPIYSRSAVNRGTDVPPEQNGKTLYISDDGEFIYHNPEDGAVKLAKMMLDEINELK